MTVAKGPKRYRQGKRRTMKKFIINELSGVDFPAQEGAKSVLLKRRDDEKIKKGEGLYILTSEDQRHGHSIHLFPGDTGGSTSWALDPQDETGHDHSWAFDEEGNIKVAMNAGHNHTVERDALVRAFRALAPALRSEAPVLALAQKCKLRFDESGAIIDILKQEEVIMTPEEIQALEKKVAQFDKLNDDLEKAQETITALEGQVAELTKAATPPNEDDVVYKADNGDVYTKADDPRLVAMAKQRDEDRKELAAERALNKQRDFEKRAGETLDAYPGELKVRAAIVKAIESIEPEETRKQAGLVVIAGNNALKGAFGQEGHGDASVDTDAVSKLDQLAKARQQEKGINYYDAYEQVAAENPKLAEAAVQGTN